MTHVVDSAAGTAVLAAVNRGSCPTDAEWEDCSNAFLVQGRMESEDDLAGTEEPPGLKKQPRKREASFCPWSQGQFLLSAIFWVKGGNGIWVDLSQVGNVEGIGVGNSKGSKK